MSLLVFFAAFILAATSVLHVAGQQLPAGSVSIDCGLGDDYSGRRDSFTGIVYVSDGPYVDGGEDQKVDAERETDADDASQRTLRSFPTGARNCYMLPTESGAKYLARMHFFYGNYDGKNSTTVQFDMHLGTNYWDTFPEGWDSWWSEAIFVAWGSWVPLCLVNTGGGTPFVNTVELRPLKDSLYPDVTADQSISVFTRVNLGARFLYRFPEDQYDRYWLPRTNSSSWANLSTQVTIQPDDNFEVPVRVLQTAVAPIGNGTELNVRSWRWDVPSFGFKVFLHFADFQNSQLRQFDISIFEGPPYRYSPQYRAGSYVYSLGWQKATDGRYSIILTATNISVLPPMINAYEIYNLIAHNNSRTFSEDVDAIMAIKLEYGVKKNWMGDPCFPVKYAWNGVNCSNITGNTARITSLDLSNSNLHGVISNNFSMLTELKYLDLSGNHLMSGPIPDSLCKSNGGSLILRYDSDENTCNKTISLSPSRNRAAIISISVVVPMVVVAVLILSYLIWRGKKKPKISKHDPPREPELPNVQGSRKIQGDPLPNIENRQFTYKELEKFTNKFGRFIGQGGFGLVYYGRLEDNTEVAVKMRSESSSHGLDEFLAEVQSLTKVHHRNLVSLVGYCCEKDHLALVYEYMSRGNLCDHLRGKSGDETFNWGTRVRIVLDAAQGLDYLHKGCSLPIIHRDVKSSNILLGQNLRAKIADFGLCKTYLSDTQTHISTNAAGSAGYFDPEYYHTGRLTESSDVYSLGVVLLEIATGEPPIAPSHGHIVQRVKQMVATGNISSVADARLGGSYEVTSMWKVVDTAMACTSDAAIGRPTMAAVVAQLKESLALEEARQDRVGRIAFVNH